MQQQISRISPTTDQHSTTTNRAHIVAESRAAREDYEHRRALGADQGSLQDTLARRISRLSGNQSSSGTNVSEFGRED